MSGRVFRPAGLTWNVVEVDHIIITHLFFDINLIFLNQI